MSGYLGSVPVPQATQHRESFTCTEGQTSFATAGYTAQFVDVYLNGSHLSPADFTATNGSDVVLAVAASADDVCDIISYTPFEVANQTFTGNTIMTNGDNTAQLTLTSTDADAALGPLLDFYRNSGSPADFDALGKITFTGRNDNSQDVIYAVIESFNLDVSDGTEDGELTIRTMLGGSLVNRMDMVSTETSFNEGDNDLNFRVESSGLPNMFHVDGGEDKIFIGHGATHYYDAYGTEIMMQLEAAGTAPYAGFGMIQNSNDADSAVLIFGKSRGTALASTTVAQDGDVLGRIEFQGMDGADLETGASIFAAVDGTPGANDMPGRLVFNTTADNANSATERMRINSSGNVGIGTASTGHPLEVKKAANGDFVVEFDNTGSSPYGLSIKTSGVSTDNNTTHFLFCADATTTRLFIDSDGDVRNHDNSYGAISDERVKQNISDASSQWDDIKAFKVRKFKLKDDVRAYGDDAKFKLGLVSQEAEKVSPNIISESPAGASDILSSSEFGTLYTKDDKETQDAVLYTEDDKDEKGNLPEGKEIGDVKTLSTNQIGDIKERKTTVKAIKYSILYMKAVKALQEAMTRIEALETKVKTLEDA